MYVNPTIQQAFAVLNGTLQYYSNSPFTAFKMKHEKHDSICSTIFLNERPAKYAIPQNPVF